MRTQYIITILFCILWGWKTSAQTSTQNYVSTEKVLVSGQTAESNVDGLTYTSKRTHVEYVDGLGRSIQTNDYKGSADGTKDIITSTGYDVYGRQEKSYLPFAKANNNMEYYGSATAVDNFSIYGESEKSFAFSQIRFEASPLNRVFKQAAPGGTWSMDNGKEVKTDYDSNVASDVMNYTVSSSNLLNLTATAYAANMLYATTVWDENNTQSTSTSRTIEFKDKLGQVVLKRSYNGSTKFSTYYVYNDKGLLSCVIPPKATADDGSLTSTELDQLCYQYKYDERNRLIEKKLPGAGWEYLIYDSKDRLVLTQDAKLRAVNSNQYHYTLYDSFNRPIEQGISTERLPYVSGVDDYALRKNVERKDFYIPTSRDALIYTYYDKYSTTFSWGYPYTSVYSQHTQVNDVKELVTGIKAKVLRTTDTWIYTVNYYDKYGRLLQQHQSNPGGGFNRVSMAYDFEGKVTDKQTLHKKTSGSTGITLYENFTYDHMGRLTASRFGYNTTTLTTLAANIYDDLGRLTSKRQHNSQQYNDYAYNVRGWLTQINDPDVASTSSKLFAMKLFYDIDMTATLTGAAQYNGNINGIKWRLYNNGSNQYKGYNFTYDGLNRLTQGDYGTSSGSTWTNVTNYDLSSVSYDANGNITSLICKNSGEANRENLTYSYSGGGNQLSSVSGTYNSVAWKSGSFTYNNNGDVISDGLRGITTVAYFNEINLPRQYSKNASNKVDYTYDAQANKWSKIATTSGTTATTLYYGPFVYVGTTLSKVLTPEGYYDPAASLYHYYLKDHLGDNRITYYYSGSTPVIDQEVEYYPFGSMFAQNNLQNNLYLYNGKELNNEFFENYDYGARFYDPALGRWHSVDPLAEKYRRWSPYNYCLDNPIRFFDIEGMGPGDPFKTRNEAAIDWAKTYNGVSIKNGWEYGSTIYSNTTNGVTNYSYSEATTLQKAHTTNITPAPENTKPEAEIHSHSGYDAPTDNSFSEEDLDRSDQKKLDAYVATPNGSLLEHDNNTDHSSDNDKLITTDIPFDPKDPSVPFVQSEENINKQQQQQNQQNEKDKNNSN